MDDSLSMLAQLSTNFPGIQALILMIIYITGLVLVIVGIHYWATGSGRGSHGMGNGVIASYILVGFMMISVVQFVQITGDSFMSGTDPRVILSDVPIDRDNPLLMTLAVVYQICSVIGFYAFGRGLYSFAMAGSRKQDGFWSGVILCIVGVACINLKQFATLLARSTGAEEIASF